MMSRGLVSPSEAEQLELPFPEDDGLEELLADRPDSKPIAYALFDLHHALEEHLFNLKFPGTENAWVRMLRHRIKESEACEDACTRCNGTGSVPGWLGVGIMVPCPSASPRESSRMDLQIVELPGDVLAVHDEDSGLTTFVIRGEVLFADLDSAAYRVFLFGWRVGRHADRIAAGRYTSLDLQEAMQWT